MQKRKVRSMIKINEGVSHFPLNAVCVANKVGVFILFNFATFWAISFTNWRPLEELSLTSIYTSLLGLKVLLTICNDTLMCGIECRRWMIIDFSICMMFPYTQLFLYSLIRRYTNARRERKLLLLEVLKSELYRTHLRNNFVHSNI